MLLMDNTEVLVGIANSGDIYVISVNYKYRTVLLDVYLELVTNGRVQSRINNLGRTLR